MLHCWYEIFVLRTLLNMLVWPRTLDQRFTWSSTPRKIPFCHQCQRWWLFQRDKMSKWRASWAVPTWTEMTGYSGTRTRSSCWMRGPSTQNTASAEVCHEFAPMISSSQMGWYAHYWNNLFLAILSDGTDVTLLIRNMCKEDVAEYRCGHDRVLFLLLFYTSVSVLWPNEKCFFSALNICKNFKVVFKRFNGKSPWMDVL